MILAGNEDLEVSGKQLVFFGRGVSWILGGILVYPGEYEIDDGAQC